MPKEIIEASIKGDLVLFCGAGVSTESRAVLPWSFYQSVQEELELTDSTLSFSELMQEYCKLPNGRKKLLRKIRERFNYIDSFPELQRQATSFHRELSQIHSIKTIITTNWDTYFEDYCGAIPITIPDDFVFWDNNVRCVLKIHGSIQNLSSIVATKEDYKKRLSELQNGIMGATLKTILATKTVVFIGFSFGDEDFEQIIQYLRTEMGELYPHIYVVTLDATLEKRLEYKNSTFILTAGDFFIHTLKQHLIADGKIINTEICPIVSAILGMVQECHKVISEISIKEYPSVIYTLAYQDGIIHSLERCLENYHTGEYNHPYTLKEMAKEYNVIVEKCRIDGNYWDEAYYEGYLNGLILLDVCENIEEVAEIFPILYLPNSKKELDTLEVYMDELSRLSNGRSKYNKYARENTKGNVEDLVLHHPPY